MSDPVLVASRLIRNTPVRLALFSVLAVVLVWPTLRDAARINEFRDAQVLQLYEHAAVDTVRLFGEFPSWNPYYCGGFDAVGTPQSRFFSPMFLLSLLFGPERGEVVTVFALAVLGMEGTYRWLRLRVPSTLASVLVAPVFALSGHFSSSFFRGWTNFFGFELVPWILLGVTLAVRGRVVGIAIASIAFGVVLGFGGTFAAPLIAIAAACEGLRALAADAKRSRGEALAMLAATASSMAAVAFVRLWPIAETLAVAPRIMAGTPAHAPVALWSALTGKLSVAHANVAFVGSFFVGSAFLMVAAVGVVQRRFYLALLPLALFVWLALGYYRPLSAFAALRALPVFSAIRYPERFLWLAILFASELAAGALWRAPRWSHHRMWQLGATVGLTVLVGSTIVREVSAFHRVAEGRSLADMAGAPPGEFRQARGNRWLGAYYASMGLGSLSCWETHPVLEAPGLRADLPAEEYLRAIDADAGKVVRVRWSPTRIELHTSVTRPARVVVNQNWHPGWRAAGGVAVSDEGLLAVDVPAGESDVTLSFRSWTTVAGGAVSLTALVALVALGVRARRRGPLFSRKNRLVSSLLVVTPWVVASSAYAFTKPPVWPPPQMRNPNGEPAIVADGEAPPAGALQTAFEQPLRVEAGKVRGPDANGNLQVDVYLRRTGVLPRANTMFVHVERRKSEPEPRVDTAPAASDKSETTPTKFVNADHQVISGSYYLADLPNDRLVHDAFGVHLDKPMTGTWDVWVAFGHVSGRGPRTKVTNAGLATVDADRVRLGTFVVP